MTPTVSILFDVGADTTVPLPSYETAGAAGADIRANLSTDDRATGICLNPGARALIPTGLRMEIPEGFELQVRPRSGLALKQGLTCLNTPGTIDCDYRGPVGVILINLGQEPVTIQHGDRIAQIVVAPVTQARFAVADELTETQRGSSGFGSTGTD
ncbi:dUTP diphosphatase [Shimia ponticola]|uniref:dUTP diphosphatase n=1 Tax=Shimia ponticola TaxID=2582893 RepID=UPI0011BF23BE|nr:dUTP diphosphatase [Shimia ponticola]